MFCTFLYFSEFNTLQSLSTFYAKAHAHSTKYLILCFQEVTLASVSEIK